MTEAKVGEVLAKEADPEVKHPINFPDDLKHLRIEGIAVIEIMRTAHHQGQHMIALEQALEYVRIVKRVVAKAEAEINEAIQEVPA